MANVLPAFVCSITKAGRKNIWEIVHCDLYLIMFSC